MVEGKANVSLSGTVRRLVPMQHAAGCSNTSISSVMDTSTRLIQTSTHLHRASDSGSRNSSSQHVQYKYSKHSPGAKEKVSWNRSREKRTAYTVASTVWAVAKG